MTRPRLSVTARLALLAVALSLLSNLALIGLIRHQAHGDAIDALRREVVEQADALGAVGRSGGAGALRRSIERTLDDADDPALVIAVVDRGGRRLAGAGPDRIAPPGRPLGFRIEALASADPWSQDAGYVVARAGPDWLLVGRLLDDRQLGERALERALALAALLSLALGVAAGLVLARYVGGRLDRIADVADRVAAGDLSRRVAMVADGRDAFDRLGGRVNVMLDRVERLMEELRLVTDSLAHDLRSPLARLRSHAESALGAPDGPPREAALASLIAETDLVMRMLATLLEISRSEAMSRDRLAPTDAAALIESIAELYAPAAEDAGLTFEVAVERAPAALPLHRELLSQAVANLLDNALAHAARGGGIVLRLTGGAEALTIAVEDRGPGIAVADRARALARFGRLDEARSRPGAGLGLALIAAVARFHGGRLELDDNAPGLIARIVIPRPATLDRADAAP